MKELKKIERSQRKITLTGDAAMAMEYATKLIRSKFPEFEDMTNEEMVSFLVEIGLNQDKEVFA